jgi:predicted nucleic acid-binding protein
VIEEIDRNREEICKRIGLKTEFLNYILEELILPRLNIVEESSYANKISEAYAISKEFDEKDTPFIALALKLKTPIWTNDKSMIEHGIKSQAYLAVDTEALIKVLKGELKLDERRPPLQRSINVEEREVAGFEVRRSLNLYRRCPSLM